MGKAGIELMFIHEDGMWLPQWLNWKTVTYTKISPKMVNPRDLAGERRRRRTHALHSQRGHLTTRPMRGCSQLTCQLLVMPSWHCCRLTCCAVLCSVVTALAIVSSLVVFYSKLFETSGIHPHISWCSVLAAISCLGDFSVAYLVRKWCLAGLVCYIYKGNSHVCRMYKGNSHVGDCCSGALQLLPSALATSVLHTTEEVMPC